MSSMPTEPAVSNSQNTCCLCLETTIAMGGGVPLVCPGCCGKWFHQKCMDELIKKGNGLCPCCRAPLPSSGSPVAQQAVGISKMSVSATNALTSPPLPNPPNVVQNTTSSSTVGTISNMVTQAFGFRPNAPVVQSVFRNSLSHSSRNDGDLTEDQLLPSTTTTNTTTTTSSPAKTSTSDGMVPIALSSTPELSTILTRAYNEFHALASIMIPDSALLSGATTSSRKYLDVVCVLDKSGSMSGAKFTYLKHAVRFIQSQLGENDRLSLVTFDSSAHGVHGLLRMTEAQKSKSEQLLNDLSAGGGTDIYDGMRCAYEQVLAKRKTKNAITCMLLLTDGIDGNKLNEKRQLASKMKSEGIALYVYGFGADHDSAHLNAIAEAAESSFIYVAESSEVVDAFGGTLGALQGLVAKNIQLQLTAIAPNVIIDEVKSGQYKNSIGAGRKAATVTFSNLLVGEKRSVLVRVILPEVAQAIPQYPLFEVSASYTPVNSNSNDTTVLSSKSSENSWCTVERVSNGTTPMTFPVERNVEVDAHMYRYKVNDAIKQAMDTADGGSNSEAAVTKARDILQAMLTDLTTNSVSYRNNHKIPVQLKLDLQDAIDKMKNRETYSQYGGRAVMQDAWSSNAQERCMYNKRGAAVSNAYQAPASACMQQASAVYKNKF